MGLSWSNSRRTTTFYHPHPPPPPPPPPYYYHPGEAVSPPPPPPPPHPNHYTTIQQPPPTTSSPPQSYPYPTHPPPPIHSYYNSHPYHSRNYANHNYQYQPFYYTSHYQPASGWSPVIRPSLGFSTTAASTALPIQLEPAPFVDHQNAKRIRNDVNVHKDTLKVEIDVSNPDHHLVSFVFDALFDGSITIFYFAKEEPDGRFVPAFPEVHLPVKISFQKGPGQRFYQPSGTGIDLGFFELDDLSKSSPEEDVFPLVIAAETNLPDDLTDEHIDSVPNTLRHMQITQAVLEKKNGDNFHVRVIRQILWVAGVRYELREIYGIGSSAAEGFDDSDPGKECVICMTEPKDTAVLPCRHMCMCSECAKELRLQSNKCPICRQPIEQLIGIKINSGDQ
ncbi:hypothetical protein Peur_019045 [Populus x canadensis]|uniref:probable E3 ubiquitin-protein ligase LUL4 n=1 Tax=Populus nigra TaxID=3691 RepID=UPI002B26F437|nr:probable E3 ubiquitin-protein ligase LUL4 [Populus nigra]